jgi:hypothetical protein
VLISSCRNGGKEVLFVFGMSTDMCMGSDVFGFLDIDILPVVEFPPPQSFAVV